MRKVRGGANDAVTDVWLVALGFALMPMGGLLLYSAGREILDRESTALATLAGVVLFLGIAHAGADVLVGNAFLKYAATPMLSAATAAGGAMTGLGVAALLWIRRGARPSGLVAVSVAYFALHTFADGLVLGEGFAGPFPTAVPLTPAVVVGTLVHRFAEGAVIVVPAILVGWKPQKAVGLLSIGLLAVPAAYLPIGLFASPGSIPAFAAAWEAIKVFAAAAEVGFAVPLIVVGLLPRILPIRSFRPAAWVFIGFLAMLLIHFTVE